MALSDPFIISADRTKSWRTKIYNNKQVVAERSSYMVFAMFFLTLSGAWSIYYYQFQVLPTPLTLEEVGEGGFSEDEAMKHVKALTQWGPHSVGSDALENALQYVLNAAEAIKETANSEELEVEVDFFHPKSGVNRLVGSYYEGKTLVYSDLHHVVLRISPKKYASSSSSSEAEETAILVSAHVDTVFSAEGAGDDASNVAVMLELARGLSQSSHDFKHSVIFLFNTGEEEGLDGSHSFITQHPWSNTVQVAINLEAMGIGGKSGIFQAGPHPWAIENFAKMAKYPSGQVAAQDVFSSGVIKSSTDFQVYKEVGGLSGLDFAFQDNTAVYHTKNDKFELLKRGSLQHLGENMLPFLVQVATSDDLPKGKIMGSDQTSSEETAIYFDILGKYMIVFRQSTGEMFYNSAIILSFLIWATLLLMGDFQVVMSFFLSCLTLIFMWMGSIIFAGLVAFFLPSVSPSPVPFVSSPWIVVGLYGAPALLGAFIGQHVGYILLRSFLSSSVKVATAEVESERWIFKAGLLQWLILLVVATYYKIGSSYLALVWLVSPSFAYCLLEASPLPGQLPSPLKAPTLLIGLFLPFLLSSGVIIKLTATMVGTIVRYDRNPGSVPAWMAHIIVAVLVAAIVCLTLVHLLSYVHISGAKMAILLTNLIVFGLSVSAILFGLVPAFTEDTARDVNVVQVVDATGNNDQGPQSFISLFSTCPGNLNKEAEQIGGLTCGKDRQLDFVVFSVSYSCWTSKDVKIYGEKLHIPQLHVEHHINDSRKISEVTVNTKISTRWSLAINTDEIEDFQLEEESGVLVENGGNTSVNGWHLIQFAGGKNSPTKFNLRLFWAQNRPQEGTGKEDLLKLRADVDLLTPKMAHVLEKLPPWCSLYGKSSFPFTLSYLSSYPVVAS